MNHLVDTNVLTESRRPRPNAAVADWVAAQTVSTLYLSVLTLGEIRKGVETVADPVHRQRLLGWLQVDLPAYFSGSSLQLYNPWKGSA